MRIIYPKLYNHCIKSDGKKLGGFLRFNIYIQNNLVNVSKLPTFFAAAYACSSRRLETLCLNLIFWMPASVKI
jgi:hypothetical protein